jgi:predicted TIM-barrel fold metal-dependent hydrolase
VTTAMRCDSHVHIVGPQDRFPQLADRTYLADIATLKQLENASAPRAIRRFVLVQPSFYGADNSLLLDGLDMLAGRGRAVAVVNPETTSARTLFSMAEQGVRGLRLNLYSPLRDKTPLAARFDAVAKLAHELNWHVEVVAALKVLSENTTLLARSRVPVVIDHYGLYMGFHPEQPESSTVLRLLAMPHVWIKLSAPYRVSANPLATKPDPAWLAAIVAAAPERCVWGSDWPHTPPHEEQMGSAILGAYRSLRYETLVDDFMTVVGSAELAERILSVNPARLYGFD